MATAGRCERPGKCVQASASRQASNSPFVGGCSKPIHRGSELARSRNVERWSACDIRWLIFILAKLNVPVCEDESI